MRRLIMLGRSSGFVVSGSLSEEMDGFAGGAGFWALRLVGEVLVRRTIWIHWF